MVFLVYDNGNEASMHMMSERLWNNIYTRGDIDLHENKKQSFDEWQQNQIKTKLYYRITTGITRET